MGIVEWEGTAERVAWHAPYVVLFDHRFIEIRHIVTGKLVQIITGVDMRCLWDGRSAVSDTSVMMPTAESGWSDGFSLEPRVHGVMNVHTPGGGPSGGLTQFVYELVPDERKIVPGMPMPR